MNKPEHVDLCDMLASLEGLLKLSPCPSPPIMTFTCVTDCLRLPRAPVGSHFLHQSVQYLCDRLPLSQMHLQRAPFSFEGLQAA